MSEPITRVEAAVRELGALPVPVGPALTDERATIAALIGDAKPARDGLLVQLAESVRDRREHDHSTQREDWYCMNLTSFMGERMGPVLRRLLNAEARVAELETERHTTNEALDDAVQELHARGAATGDLAMVCRECNAPVVWVENTNGGWWNHTQPAEDGHGITPKPLLRSSVAKSAGKLTRTFAPTQALREVPDGEHAARVHHDYRVGRDLPELGGAPC